MNRSATAPPDLPAPVLDVVRLVQQDAAAFAELVRQTERIVLGLGQSIGLRGADLDDAAAEVYLAVYRALPSFQAKSAITTWVYAIAVRVLNRSRQKFRRTAMPSLSDSMLASSSVSDQSQHSSTGQPPLEQQEINDRLWQAVAMLDARSAMAVDLHYRRGLSIDEVATALSCPAGTVKTILFRARAELRKSIGELEDTR